MGRTFILTIFASPSNVDVDCLLAFINEDRGAFNAGIDATADGEYAVVAGHSFDCGTVPDVFGVSNGALRDVGDYDGTQTHSLDCRRARRDFGRG